MAENIGLKITLGGVTQVVSDIDKLKGSIDGAKKTLEGLEEGSEAFQQLSQEIEIATIALNAFEQTADQMDAPEKMGLLASAGKLVSSAFQSANESLKAFGIDTEKIGQSARRTFQALKKPLDQVSESLEKTGEELSNIPGPIGQVAQGVKGLGQAIKILLANPIIAVIAAVVAGLTLLFKAFTSTKAGGEQLERVMSALGAVLDVLRDRFLTFAGAVGKLFTGDLMGAVKGFRDSVSGIGKEIVNEANEAAKLKGILQQITDSTRELNKERARQNVLIADAKLRINDENLSLEDRIKALNEIRNSEINLAKQEEELAKRRFETIQRQNALSDSNKEALDAEAEAFIQYQQKILDSKTKQKELFDQEKALRDRQRAEQKAQADERLRQLKEQQDLILKTIDVEIQAYEKLKSVLTESVPEPEVVKQLRLLLDIQEALVKSVETTTFDEDFEKTFTNLIPPIEQAADSVDNFGQTFLQTRKSLVTTLGALPEEFKKVTDAVREEFSNLLQEGEITRPAFNAINQILTDYENVNNAIREFKLDGGLFDSKTYFELVKNVKIATGEITKDVDIVDGKIVGTRDVIKTGYVESVNELEEYNKQILQSITDTFNKDKDFQKLSQEDRQKKILEYYNAFIRTVSNNSDAVIKEEQRIIDFFETSLGIQTQRQEKFFLSQLGFYSQNTDKLLGELSSTIDLFSQDIEVAFDQRIKKLIGDRELTDEELEIITKLYQDFYTKLNKLREENSKGEETGFEKTKKFFENLSGAIQEFQGVLNSISQLTADYYGFQLEELERQNQRIQSNILGDTEQANQKRLEQQQIYEEKVKQLQKEQTITGLKLDLTQAIANTAQSITATFAAFGGTPPAFIANAIIAGINATQIGLISQQLASAQSLQRGGLIRKGQGGLVVGPSHEFGGVKYQGGGIELEGGETVVNRVSSVRYNDLLNQINVSGGGRPLVQNNFDDSRIVEAIARQRTEPIRAYVLESEITNKQGINRRLEQLSSI